MFVVWVGWMKADTSTVQQQFQDRRQYSHQSVPFRVSRIEINRSLSQNPGLGDDLTIHGDNLHALKALLPLHASKADGVFDLLTKSCPKGAHFLVATY